MSENVQEKLLKMKKLGKIFRIVSLVAVIVTVVMLILFFLMPATNLQTDGGKYVNGYNYYGWQLTILGCGYPPLAILCMFEPAGSAAGDYVPSVFDFDFNIITLLGIIIPIVTIIVCAIVKRRMKNRGKAVCEFITAAAILFGGIIILSCGSLSVLTATDMGAGVGFKKQYLMPAIEAGTYKTLAYPVILFVVCLLVALFKAFNGAFLLYQKAYANKNRTVKA